MSSGTGVCEPFAVKNLSPTTVFSIPCRTLSSALCIRLEMWADLNDDQSDNRTNRSIPDRNSVPLSLAVAALATGEKMYLACFDYTNAVDTDSHHKL